MYLISYDISNDRLRKKVSDCILEYGKRVQYSVFECNIDKNTYRKLYARLLELTDEMEEGSIRCYFLDKACEQKIETIGSETFDENAAVKRYDISGLSKKEEMYFI